MEPIVRAIDVGYGNTKFILNPRGLKVSIFPSIVAPVTANAGDHLNHGRNSKIVRVDHESYEVGPDARLARSRTHTDFLDDQFPLSFQYRALVAGALGEMDIDHVDLLILGLPQRTFSKLRQPLQNSMRGNHHVAEGRIVRVDAVLVVIQPMGAFYHWAVAEKKLRQTGFLEQRTLLIDPGYRTFDWVVMTGVKPMPELSGSVATGMSDVLGQIADGVSRAVGTPIDDLRRLDQGWRTSVTTRLFGTSYDLGPYAKAAIAVGENAIRAMIQKVGDGVDIDEIVLAGGGSFFFEPIVRASFQRHSLKVLDDSMFANVRGFQILGIDHMANMRVSPTTSAAAI